MTLRLPFLSVSRSQWGAEHLLLLRGTEAVLVSAYFLQEGSGGPRGKLNLCPTCLQCNHVSQCPRFWGSVSRKLNTPTHTTFLLHLHRGTPTAKRGLSRTQSLRIFKMSRAQ